MSACQMTSWKEQKLIFENDFSIIPSEDELLSYKIQRTFYEKKLLTLLETEAFSLIKKEKYDDAIDICQKLLAIDPKFPFAWNNLGVSLSRAHQYKEAIIAYKHAISLHPQFVDRIYWSMADSLLHLGQYIQGFKIFESRIKYCNTQSVVLNKRDSKRWEGENIEGKTLLVHHDGGLGDSLQFLRYIPLLKRYNCRILLFLQPELNCLFEHFNIELIKDINKYYEYDAHVFVMSLPFCFNTQMSTIPDPLHIPCRHRPVKGRIAVAWKSGADNSTLSYGKKNLILNQLESLFKIPHVHYVCVQKEITSEESLFLSKYQIETPQIRSFRDTVHILETCERLISVDTAVAHLAASMDIPTSILLPFNACWRWLCDRKDSPWYPSVTLFWQKKIDHWDEPINELERCL